MHGAIEGLAGARAGFAHYPRQPQQLCVGQGASICQWVPGRREHHQFVLPPGNALQAGVIGLPFHQAHIQLEARHLRGDGGGVGHAQGDFRPGVAMPESGDHRHGQVVADGERGTDLQAPHCVVARQRLLERPGLFQQGFGRGSQLPSQLAQLQAFANTVEQAHVELIFQFPQRATGGGLGHGQLGGRPGDILVTGGGQEDFKLAQGIAHGLTP